MKTVKVMVAFNGRVIKDGLASIISANNSLVLTGIEGSDLLEEASRLQPDLVVYQLSSLDDNQYQLLGKLKNSFSWTKLLIFSGDLVPQQYIKELFSVCDGFLQGPVLPRFLLTAVELVCYSGHFFFLGSPKMVQPKDFMNKGKVEHALVNYSDIG